MATSRLTLKAVAGADGRSVMEPLFRILNDPLCSSAHGFALDSPKFHQLPADNVFV